MEYKAFQYDGADIRIEDPFYAGEKKVSSTKTLITKEMLNKSLKPIMDFGKKMIDEAAEYGPDEIALEFGINAGFESGNLCWGIAKGSASTHFTVTMTWKSE